MIDLTHAVWCRRLRELGTLDKSHRECTTALYCVAYPRYSVEKARESERYAELMEARA